MQLGLLLLFIQCIFAATTSYKNISHYDCQTNAHCTHLLINTICFNKKCMCRFGDESNGCKVEESKLRDRRQTNYAMRMLGEECVWTNQCRQTPVDGTKVCETHKCQCSHGYVPLDSYRCIKDFEPLLPDTPVTNSPDSEPPGFGSLCSTNGDCQQTTNHLQCLQGICICLEGYVPLGKYLCYNIRGQSTLAIDSSIAISAPLSTTSVQQFLGNEVMKSLGKIGNTCTNDYFCRRAVSQSHCYNGKCTCFDGYVSIDQYTCMKTIDEETTIRSTLIPIDYKSLLGGHCLTKRNCHTPNAVCLNSVCTCPKRYFPVDDWTCLREPESSDEELIDTTSTIPTTTATTLPTTTTFRWWPWSPTPTTRQTVINLKNSFRVRCLLNRQCASMDKNSHCTLFGRCVCNPGYELKTTRRGGGQRCTSRMLNEDDCD